MRNFNTATIIEANEYDGTYFDLIGPDGVFVGTYTRRRDAVRGAKRRGLAVA